MFHDPGEFPFCASLEASWHLIREEFLRLKPSDLMPWVEKNLYDQGWDVFGLYAVGKRQDAGCRLCPETTRLVEGIPRMTMAGFSRLAPGTHIKPHVGYTSTVLRCHLGLIVPDGCALRVGSETRTWEEGKCLVFDDTFEHEAWNRSTRDRTVLLIDFVKEGRSFESVTSRALEDALRAKKA
jgi:beta-hydroxylase